MAQRGPQFPKIVLMLGSPRESRQALGAWPIAVIGVALQQSAEARPNREGSPISLDYHEGAAQGDGRLSQLR
jgi:hypothetical protein